MKISHIKYVENKAQGHGHSCVSMSGIQESEVDEIPHPPKINIFFRRF